MSASSNESVYWQLFTTIRTLFTYDIQWEIENNPGDSESAEIALQEVGQLIKVCMLEIPLHVRLENFESVDEFALFIADDLRPLLLKLQHLVHDDILEFFDNDESRPLNPSLGKLHALSYMMKRRSAAPATKMEEYIEFLNIKQDLANLREILASIEGFNLRLMNNMMKKRSDRSTIPKAKRTYRSSVADDSLSWLYTRSNPSFWGASQKLFNALVRNLSSCRSSTHSTMLSLNGLRRPDAQYEHTQIDILLPSCPQRGFWQETRCRILSQSPSILSTDDDILPETVCEAAQEARDGVCMLDVYVHEESFWFKYCDDQKPLYPNASPTVTVSQLIECGFLKDLRRFTFEDRWILALNLGQSLLQFHNGPWLQTLWGSDTFLFFYENPKQGRKLCNIHNPFIHCVMSESPPVLQRPSHFDKYPAILSFGNFLLELGNGEKLPVSRTTSGTVSPYKTLKENFNEFNTGSLSDDLKEAIKGCLDFHKFLKDESSPDEEFKIRTTIFKKIIQPLQHNLQAFRSLSVTSDIDTTGLRRNRASFLPSGPKDLDLADYNIVAIQQVSDHLGSRDSACLVTRTKTAISYASNLSTAKHQRSSPGIAEHVRGPPSRRVRIVQPKQTQRNCVSSSESETETEGKASSGRLLGTFDTKHSDKHISELQWGMTFKEISRIYNRRLQYTSADEPIRIAVLDTGIDLGHPDFKLAHSKPKKGGIISAVKGEDKQIDRIKACRNFCGDREDDGDVTDIDGHGTHVSGIILQLAPKAEVYIARVCQGGQRSKSPTPNKAVGNNGSGADSMAVHPDRVERAIEWAIGHNVHLINMSFGYKKYDHQLDLALKKARDRGIVVFAAASNSGNHEAVAWPARDPERAICVHSSNDLGTKSSEFTPQAHSKTINFMVAGEEIYSHWPVNNGGGFRAMSGTSTATPVATAVAALLLAFTSQDIVDKQKKEAVEKLIGDNRPRDLAGMRALLQHICNPIGDYCWIEPKLLWKAYDPDEIQERDPSAASNYAWEEIRKALRK